MMTKNRALICFAVLVLACLTAEEATAQATAPEINPSRIDIFAGYSYWSPHAQINGFKYDDIEQGMIFSGAYYFNRYFGGQVEGDYHVQTVNDGMWSISAGPIVRFTTSYGIIPFVHALAGAAYVTGPNVPTINSNSFQYEPATWGPQLTAGGGLDYGLPLFGHHLGLRLFQVDYLYDHINFGPTQPTTGGRANINSARLSAGLVFRFGNVVPPPPVQYSCVVNPTSVYPGDPVTITGTATNLNPKKAATYSWSGHGVTVKGDTATANVDTTDLQPGSYPVTGHVSEGQKPGQFADCTTNFTVKQYEPPTVSCSVNPSSVNAGDTVTVTATGVSPQNRPLTYSYSASAGSISGMGNTATLSTTGAPAGTIVVTANVSDDKGQTASGTCSVTINVPQVPPRTQTLCSISFGRDKKRPARVDNEAKACLDDVALNAQRSADASVVVVGNATAEEQAPPKGKKKSSYIPNLGAQRAVNTKDYLVKEKGIDASRISVRTGTAGTQEVENYLVPAGANFDNDVPGTTAVDESAVKPQPRKPLPEKHHK